MGRLLGKLKDLFKEQEDEPSSGEETIDIDAVGLSHVGQAAYHVLRKKHNNQHHITWDVTTGQVVGELDQTPKGIHDMSKDPPRGHSDWFPEKLGSIICRTERWCDIMVRTNYSVHSTRLYAGRNVREGERQLLVHSILFLLHLDQN